MANMYEQLLDYAHMKNVDVYEGYMPKRIKGLYSNRVIKINKRLNTTAEKASVLAEELGHYHTTSGNILDQTLLINRKQELKARSWAYEKAVPISKIIDAHRLNITNLFELASYLGVTESFLEEALSRYKDKHGLSTMIDNYSICFEPLGVIEWFDHKNF